MNAILAEVINQLGPAVVTLLSVLVSALMAYATQWLRTKVKNDQINAILDRLMMATQVTVNALAQTVVDDLKGAAADGKLTPEEIKGVQAKAIASVMVHLGPQGVKELKAIVGDDLNTLILNYIESQVAITKGSV